MKWINREFKTLIKQAAETFPALVLCGARQAGKTALLRHIFPDAEFCSLDYPQLAREAEESPELFLSRFKGTVIIDEVQYAPTLFKFIKIHVDRNRDLPCQFILTGSQNFALMQNISESLAGRCAVLQLPTLSLEEILEDLEKEPNDRDILECVTRGGYPELWSHQAVNQMLWLSSYVSTYLERDVRNWLNVKNIRDFNSLMQLLALQVGQQLNYSTVAKRLGVSVPTIKEWVSVLEASDLIYLMPPYYNNMGKRLVKTPKVYFNDTGLACHLCGIHTVEMFIDSPMRGHIWENFVIGQLLRHYQYQGLRPPLYFWRTSAGHEVDCIIKAGGLYHLFEIKFAEQPSQSDTKGFNSFAKIYGAENIKAATIISRTPYAFNVTEEFRTVNCHEARKLLP